jgi:hypothetical protein
MKLVAECLNERVALNERKSRNGVKSDPKERLRARLRELEAQKKEAESQGPVRDLIAQRRAKADELQAKIDSVKLKLKQED